MPRAELPPGAKRKIIEFDAETRQALHTLALDRMNALQELADEAFAVLLKQQPASQGAQKKGARSALAR